MESIVDARGRCHKYNIHETLFYSGLRARIYVANIVVRCPYEIFKFEFIAIQVTLPKCDRESPPTASHCRRTIQLGRRMFIEEPAAVFCIDLLGVSEPADQGGGYLGFLERAPLWKSNFHLPISQSRPSRQISPNRLPVLPLFSSETSHN